MNTLKATVTRVGWRSDGWDPCRAAPLCIALHRETQEVAGARTDEAQVFPCSQSPSYHEAFPPPPGPCLDHSQVICLPLDHCPQVFLHSVAPRKNSFVHTVRAEGGSQLDEMFYLGSQRLCL